jgi:hypothetical protein
MGFYREQPRLLRTDTGSGAEAPRGSRLQSTGLPVFYYAPGFECFWFLEDPEEPLPPLAEVVVPGVVAPPPLLSATTRMSPCSRQNLRYRLTIPYPLQLPLT